MLRIEPQELPPAEYAVNRSHGRSHWYKKKARLEALNVVGVALNEAGWDHGAPIEKAHVKVLFYLPTKVKRDHGSLVERMKPIWDALTEPTYFKSGEIQKDGYGVLKDDDLNCIGFPEYKYEYRPRKPGTIIEVAP